MRRARLLGIGAVVAALGFGALHPAAPAASAARAKNVYTPVLAVLLSQNDPAPVLGTDRRLHVVYELRLANRGPIPATLQKLEVLDADSGVAVHAYDGADLQTRVRAIGGVTASSTVIEPGGERLFMVDLAFGVSSSIPLVLEHRLQLLGPKSPRATEATVLTYMVAPVPLDGPAPPVLVPPLRGNGWVVTSGCCDIANTDRTAILPVNGGLWSPLRFAIDLMQLDDTGLFVHDDPTQLPNFTGYGADVLAVAPGKVVGVLDTLPDEAAGAPPGSASSSFESADGNSVVLALGNGSFAFYGNLQPGSLTVKVGDRVQRREVLGTLGNSGDSSYPHLSFRLMSGASPFGSDGLPFVFNAFSYEGQLDSVKYFIEGVTANYLENRVQDPIPVRRELPLGFAIIDFGTPGGAGAVGRT
ncbi:MAG: M23 family metallopeptidase [Acidimicrobiia bacterium]